MLASSRAVRHDMVTDESFGGLVRRYRRDAELTQEALAERAGLSVRAISAIEAGSKHRPRQDTVRLLLDALAVPEEEQGAFLAAAVGRSQARAPVAGFASEAGTVPGPQLLTVLIADLRGYTAYCAEQGDEAGMQLAERFAAATRPVVEGYDGTLLELRGDEALCVFRSARQALRAALALQEQYGRDENDGGLPLGAGIGLDAGEIVPLEGGYRGRALNLAARLCSLAAPGEVLASESVLHLAGAVDGMRALDRGMVTLKNLAEPVRVMAVSPEEIFALGRASEMPRTGQELPRGKYLGSLPDGPLVGREEQVAPLADVLDEVLTGAGRLVLLAGEAGVGKTRLAQEVTALAHGRGFLLAAGRCYEPEQTVAYYPFLDALGTLFRLAPAELQREPGRRWPYLAALLPDQLRTPEVIGGRDEEQLVFRAVTGFLEALAGSGPIGLLLDDLHWADRSSLKLLLHVIRHTQSVPLLILGTYRDVEVDGQHPLARALHDLHREGLATELAVRRLPEDGTRALIAAVMEEKISEEFATLVHGRTEGNPYFVQQVLRDLVERGDVFRRDGHWDRKAIEDLTVPESIRATVQQRAGKLSDGTRDVLQEASVLGQSFVFEDVQGMGDRSEGEVEQALEETVTVALIQEMDGDRYAFDHALTQQALYAEMTTRRKRRLHLAAADAIERGSGAEKRASELAWHSLRAGDRERALRYSLEAGKQAERAFAPSEAELHYRTALELARELERPGDEAETLEHLGQVLRLACRYDEAVELLEQAAAMYHAGGNIESAVRTVGQIAEVHYWNGSLAEGVARVDSFLDSLQGTQPPRGTARLYVLQALNAFFGDQISASDFLSRSESAVALARSEADTGAFVLAESLRVQALRMLGRYDEAVRAGEALEPLAESREDEDSIVALEFLGETYLFSGRLEHARGLLTRLATICQRRADSDYAAFCLTIIGFSHVLEGDWQAARTWYLRALKLQETGSSSYRRSFTVVWFGDLAVREGSWAEAGLLLDEAMARALEIQNPQHLILAHGSLTERDLLQGQVAEALARHRQLMGDPQQNWKLTHPPPAVAMMLLAAGDVDGAQRQIDPVLKRRKLEGRFRTDWRRCLWTALHGRVLAARGRWAEAEVAFQEAIAEAHHTGIGLSGVFEQAQVLQWYGEALAAHGEGERTRQRLEEAHAIYLRVGAAPYIAQTETALARLPT
jgi:class 3 adenylate cyclase/tetratricopeptide (TPR) repeat protein